MNQLVYIENNKPVTDSLQVALTFGKRHADVLRSIEHSGFSTDFTERNFALSDYRDSTGRRLPKYIISQDGFSMLAMGYTGAAAIRFKEMYIAEFNRMAAKLNGNPSGVQALLQATQNLIDTQMVMAERMDAVESKVDAQITLNSGQQRALQQAINKKVCSIEPISSERRDLFRQIHKEIKDRWQVASYKDVLRHELEGVLEYVKAWVPVRRIEL